MQAAFVIIGNEILSGRTKDANLNFLATELTEMGIRLSEVRVVEDVEDDIVLAINELRAKFDYVFTSGGIGPTHDDITSFSVAKAFGQKYIRNAQAEKILRDYYKERINESRLKMADMPENAELIENTISSAPGYRIENVFVMAGVPAIMQVMFFALKDQLQSGDKMLSKTLDVFVAESEVAEEFANLQAKYITVEMGSYPFKRDDKFGTSLVLRSFSEDDLDKAYKELKRLFNQ